MIKDVAFLETVLILIRLPVEKVCFVVGPLSGAKHNLHMSKVASCPETLLLVIAYVL